MGEPATQVVVVPPRLVLTSVPVLRLVLAPPTPTPTPVCVYDWEFSREFVSFPAPPPLEFVLVSVPVFELVLLDVPTVALAPPIVAPAPVVLFVLVLELPLAEPPVLCARAGPAAKAKAAARLAASKVVLRSLTCIVASS